MVREVARRRSRIGHRQHFLCHEALARAEIHAASPSVVPRGGTTEVERRSADVVDASQELRYAFVPQGQQPVA